MFLSAKKKSITLFAPFATTTVGGNGLAHLQAGPEKSVLRSCSFSDSPTRRSIRPETTFYVESNMRDAVYRRAKHWLDGTNQTCAVSGTNSSQDFLRKIH